jgi:hypothetical protein
MTLAAMSGCGIQPKIIEARHWELNDTIRTTTDEQLLLNIVRLRYDEMPYFCLRRSWARCRGRSRC